MEEEKKECYSMPLIGDEAPHFKAKNNNGRNQIPR